MLLERRNPWSPVFVELNVKNLKILHALALSQFEAGELHHHHPKGVDPASPPIKNTAGPSRVLRGKYTGRFRFRRNGKTKIFDADDENEAVLKAGHFSEFPGTPKPSSIVAATIDHLDHRLLVGKVARRTCRLSMSACILVERLR